MLWCVGLPERRIESGIVCVDSESDDKEKTRAVGRKGHWKESLLYLKHNE